MNKKCYLFCLGVFLFSISLLNAMEQEDESLNLTIETMKILESQDSDLLNLMQATKTKKSFFNRENFFIAGTAATTVIATILYHKYNPKAFEESWQYIYEIPTHVKLFFSLGVGYLLLEQYLHTLQIKRLEELYTYQLKKNKLMSNNIQQLAHIAKLKSEEMQQYKIALNVLIFKQGIFDLKYQSDYSELRKNHESLNSKFTLRYKHLEDKIRIIKQEHEGTSFLTDIFNELHEDIRYRKLLSNAESAQKNSDSYHKFNLGGVE